LRDLFVSMVGSIAMWLRRASLNAAWTAAVTDLSQRVEPEEAPAGTGRRSKGRSLSLLMKPRSLSFGG
jgi:hypothetical protein